MLRLDVWFVYQDEIFGFLFRYWNGVDASFDFRTDVESWYVDTVQQDLKVDSACP
jgi:hypothetical protein